MRHVIIGSFLGFVLAAAFLAACGGSSGGGSAQATIDELEQQLAQLRTDLTAHASATDAHHARASETPWLGLRYCIALVGTYPSRNLEMPGDPGTELAYEPQLGSVALFAGTFAPRGWAFCEGQLLPINQNQSLFSLLGTTYGGDGRTTFALPDLRGRTAVGAGQGPGLAPVTQGQQGP